MAIVSDSGSREDADRVDFDDIEGCEDEIALRELLNLNHVSVMGCQELMKLG